MLSDFYGHGYSSAPKRSYTVELFRTQLEQLLKALNLLAGRGERSVVLVGHSMGGA